LFNRLEKTNLPEQIAQRIRAMILEQHLGAGERLPPERELADQFGVSRSSIREGIKLLAAQGLVDIRTGDGTFVSSDLTTSVLQPISWAISLSDASYAEFVEVRMLLEPAIAALAALRANEDDKAEMFETIQNLEASQGDTVKVVEADMDFHLVLARSIGNQVIFEMIVGFQRIIRPLMAGIPLDLDFQNKALQEHREIYEAILRGDATTARKLMAKSIAKDKDAELIMAAIIDNPIKVTF
jgi:GntR family transcriptional repressor for pyruvate dehydrogenase complex